MTSLDSESEISALQKKLKSKSEALFILNEELIRCQVDRDRFKKISDNLICQRNKGDVTDLHCVEEMADYIKTLKGEIKHLKTELNRFLKESYDYQMDIKALRSKLQQNVGKECEKCVKKTGKAASVDGEKIALVEQLEKLQIRHESLEQDYRWLLEEKEELSSERNCGAEKIRRLNHELAIALRVGQDAPLSYCDLDSLIMENKYLREKMEHLQSENETLEQSVSKYKVSLALINRPKYCSQFCTALMTFLKRRALMFLKTIMKRGKSMLDAKKVKGSLKLGCNHLSGMVVSYKQVQHLMEHGSPSWLQNREATVSDLKTLALALFDALQDKSVALVHQKKANKLLATRVSELEKLLNEEKVTKEMVLSPSQILLEGYQQSPQSDPKALLNSDRYADMKQSFTKEMENMFLEALTDATEKPAKPLNISV